MKDPNSAVITASKIMTATMGAAVAALAAALPRLTRWYLNYTMRTADILPETLITLYAALMPAVIALISLWKILTHVKKESIFTRPALTALSVLPVCCFAETVVFAVLTVNFLFSVTLAVASFFLGLLLIVVRNVIKVGCEVKEENDFTI